MHIVLENPASGSPNSGVRREEDVLVDLVGVEKTYDGKTPVVRDLNLSVRRGEFLTLLGPSGSGKTSTLMMLAGFEDPTSGNIFLEGKSLANVPPYRRNIGVVFQNYALFPHMSVLDNIVFPLRQRGMRGPERRKKAQQALDMVELGALGGRRPSQLSGGQQQRVALARALVFEPQLVLMDEPLGALDKSLREQMQFEIRRLHKELGMTVVYVTHDQNEALTMSDRIAVFDKGRVQQIGTPREIYRRPETLFVANFVGESNCMEGTVESNLGPHGRIRLSDLSSIAVPKCDFAIDEAVVVMVRPEDLQISKAIEDGCNALAARFNEAIYCGDHSLMKASLPDGREITVRQASKFADEWEAGTECFVIWQPETTIVLKPDGYNG